MAQKAKVKWSIKGDENTSFFHGVINKKRNLFNIRGIMVDGSWVDEPSMSELEGEVSNDEIKMAVWDCGTNKVPGPDGFTFGFCRRFWYLIDNDVYVAVKHFFIHREIPKGCNSSFIALISKIPDANLAKDFRPISLIGSLYKIIAKILANRLAGVLGDIVNEVQSAFVADRQILDGPFILNEVIQWCKLKKKQSLVFKFDFEKAYDSVRWDFLDDILGKLGFGDKWRMWIQSCLKSSRGSIIINGSPTEEFQFFEGLKQCDPLSPFLFILVTESLHLLFQRVEKAKMFKGVHVESDKVKEAALRLGCLTLKTPFLYLGSKDKSLWVRVIKAMYGANGKIDAEKGITLRDFMRIKLGNEENTSFWEDCWIEGDSLRNRFPRLYTLESCKRITAGEKMHQPSLEFSFRRNTKGGVEQEQLGDLVTLMHDVSLSLMSDRCTWALENSEEFTVSSVRKHIDDKLIAGVGSKTRWINYVPIKVNVNAWKVNWMRCRQCLMFHVGTTRMITHWWDVSYEDFVDYDDWRTWIINLRLPSKNKMMLE
nr:RNA-directed DNA polymerase, eukaryota [Tanacetum cinerariifolium]